MTLRPMLAAACLALTALAGFGLAQHQGGGGMQAFGGQEERMSTRVLYFGNMSSPGGVFLDYGTPEWKPEYDTKLDEMTKGKRVRFGKGVWTCFDTNLPLTAGSTKIAPSLYYCALERSKDDRWTLILLDPAAVRAKKLDAFQTDATTGGISIELKHGTVKESAQKLSIALEAGKDDPKSITLTIHWGTHQLTTQLAAQLGNEQ
ncbi:MAG: hypothetical protein U1E76_21395 [Planctomycetota bacterium]